MRKIVRVSIETMTTESLLTFAEQRRIYNQKNNIENDSDYEKAKEKLKEKGYVYNYVRSEYVKSH